jgi:hypothetical protein
VKDIEEVKRHKLLLPSEHDVLVVLHGTGKLVVSMTVMYVTAAKQRRQTAKGESDIP